MSRLKISKDQTTDWVDEPHVEITNEITEGIPVSSIYTGDYIDGCTPNIVYGNNGLWCAQPTKWLK